MLLSHSLSVRGAHEDEGKGAEGLPQLPWHLYCNVPGERGTGVLGQQPVSSQEVWTHTPTLSPDFPKQWDFLTQSHTSTVPPTLPSLPSSRQPRLGISSRRMDMCLQDHEEPGEHSQSACCGWDPDCWCREQLHPRPEDLSVSLD